MKSFKTLTNTLFEQGPPSRLKQTTTKPVTVTKPATPAKAKPADKPADKPAEVKAGELSADTKKKASINSFSTIGLSDVYDDEYFAVKMNNLYSSNSALYTKVKDQLIAKGYKFKDRFNVDPIDFYHQEVSLSRVRSLAPDGQEGKLYWPVIRELFKNYAPAGDKVGFNTIRTLQKSMTVTFKEGAQKTFDTGMEYFLTRLKQATIKTAPFRDAEARCFLAFICTLAPSALAELTAYAKADQNFSSVSDPESIILGEIDVDALINFYKIFVQGVRKSTKGDNWTIDAAWVVTAGFAKKNTTVDTFFNMVNAAVAGNYIDEALPKIKAYSAPSTGYYTPIM